MSDWLIVFLCGKKYERGIQFKIGFLFVFIPMTMSDKDDITMPLVVATTGYGGSYHGALAEKHWHTPDLVGCFGTLVAGTTTTACRKVTVGLLAINSKMACTIVQNCRLSSEKEGMLSFLSKIPHNGILVSKLESVLGLGYQRSHWFDLDLEYDSSGQLERILAAVPPIVDTVKVLGTYLRTYHMLQL